MGFFISLVMGVLVFSSTVFGWDDHAKLTKLSLQSVEGFPKVEFEKLENVFPFISVDGRPVAQTLEEFGEQLKIHLDKIDWNRFSDKSSVNALDLLISSVDEPDHGMDENLDLVGYQKMMGGTTGPGSKAIRHMYYPSWDWQSPVVTFHLPFHEMGFAPERARIYFELARQAKKSGHLFWAHRFLGWSLHYLQDLTQPYHASQFVDIRMLFIPISRWPEFVAEVTRRVSNYHLSYERYAEYLVNNGLESIANAFLVPVGNEGFRSYLASLDEKSMNVEVVAKNLANRSGRLSAQVYKAQRKLMGKTLVDPEMNLIEGFYWTSGDSAGAPKIRFNEMERDKSTEATRKDLHETMAKALSNTGVITRWVYSKVFN